MSFDGNFNLYLSRTVLVELEDGRTLTGELDQDAGWVLVNGARVDPAQIRDVLYVDKLDMDTFTLKERRPAVPELGKFMYITPGAGGLLMDPEELAREVGPDFAFGEKIVEFVCHLYFDKNSGRIGIRDMRVTRSSHAYKRDVLESGAFLYRMEDGPYFYATLEGDSLQTPEGPVLFDPDRITDITVCPQPGQTATVILQDGQKIHSMVVSASAKGLVMAEGYNGRVPFDKIRQIRYQAQLNTRADMDGSKMEACGDYRYRHRYLRQNGEYAFREGLRADFAVGMTNRGLISKDVDLACFDERQEDYGVLVEYTNTLGYGYAVLAYERAEPEGTVNSVQRYYVRANALPKGWNNNDIDTHKNLYVIRFRHMPNPKPNPNHDSRIVTSMEIVKQFERHRYQSIRVDEQGNILEELLETPEDISDAFEEGYGFLCHFSRIPRKTGYGYICRQATQAGAEYDYYFRLSDYMAKCRGQSLDTKNYCYLVRYSVDKRGAQKLPEAYKLDLLEAYPKGKDYYVNERGQVSDYKSTEFTVLDALRNERVVVITKDNNRHLGVLQSNDGENNTVVISLTDGQEETFHYSRIAEVWGLGRVIRYDPDSTYGFIQAGSGIYYRNNAVQSEKEPKLELGELVGFRLEPASNGVQANPVRPLTEVVEEGYVTGANQNGTYQVIPADIYGTERHISAVPEQLRLQNPGTTFKDLVTQDYKVQLHSLYFAGGAPLLRGIEKRLFACNKLYFGYVDKFCNRKKSSGKFVYGFVTPLNAKDQKNVFFHISQNKRLFEQVVEPGENPNKAELCLVTYQVVMEKREQKPMAINMNALRRFPKLWFERFLSGNQTAVPESVEQPEQLPEQLPEQQPVSAPGESLQGRINFCLKENDVEGAKKLLEEYEQEKAGRDIFYYQQLHNIYMKEYKLIHTPEIRRGWLECIRTLRKDIDQTEQYGLRLDLLYKQANMTMEEGQVAEALELYRQWKRLLEELCAIYPSKKLSYQTYVTRVDRILGAEGKSKEAEDLDSEENGPSGEDLHAYLEWRLDNANKDEDADLWAKAHSLRQKSGENRYPEVLKAAVKAELAGIPSKHLRYRAHFALLDLLLDPRSTTDALLPYFEDALADDSTFAQVLGLEEAIPKPDAASKGCSRFTLDSVILFAVGDMDHRHWLERFENDALRWIYIQELCRLLGRRTERGDMEELETVFTDAVALLQQPLDGKLQIHQYAAAMLERVDRFRKQGVAVPDTVEAILRDLKNYNNCKGFSARMGCLRNNATKLQAYHQSIQKTPTVHDWNLLWPLCARLIGQIQREWHTLLKLFVPSIEFGSVHAVRESGDTWKVTVPLHNSKNAQKASNVKILGFEPINKKRRDLYGDGRADAFEIRVKPADPNAEQMMLDLEVSYQYVSDVQFSNEEYKQIYRIGTARKTVSVSCAASQRQELSMDIITAIGGNAKGNIDIDDPAGRTVAEILKNRAEEVAAIISAISVGEKGSRKLLRDGRWVVLYGQWRVGKTVILHEVLRALQGAEFGDQVVPVYAMFSEAENFEAKTVTNISDSLLETMDVELVNPWEDFRDEWAAKYGEPKTLYDLGRMLGRFHQKIAPKTIVLALDEFTNIYVAIKKGYVDPSFLRSFVEFVGKSRCVIMTAGGEHSVRLMTDYDVNMLQKADCRLEVKYLSKEDTAKYVEAVITVPSYLGTQDRKTRTIDRIFELTQGNVFLLHKFCEALIRYVQKQNNLTQIDDITIQRTLDGIVKSEPDVISVYFNSLYNPYNELLNQKGQGFGGVRELNLMILKGIVSRAFPDTHSCRKDDLAEDFADEVRFEEFLKTLIERSVVREDSGNLSIPIDLFYEIQTRIERKDENNEY